MNGRHLTKDEKSAIIRTIDECGFPEVIRLIGSYVANEHPCAEVGSDLRGELNEVARNVDNAWKALAQP